MSRELSSWQRTSRFQQLLVTIIAISLLSTITYLFHSFKLTVARTISLEESGDPGSIDESNLADGLNVTTGILLVSAMFPLTKSKHSVEDYISWFSMFLGPITTDIYFYTPPVFSPNIQKARGEGLPITLNTSYASPFDIPPLMGLEEKYQKMHKNDREMFRHFPELYAVWNAKPFFLDSALKILQRQGKVYDYAFWTDAGSFRENYAFKDWPDTHRVDHFWKKGSEISGTARDGLIFFPLSGLPESKMKHWTEEMGPVDNEVSEGKFIFLVFSYVTFKNIAQGSFFGGSSNAVSWWSKTYYAYHDHYLSFGHFVGKDQTLINALFLLFPERVIAIWHRDPEAPAHAGILPFFDSGYLGACGTEWYYYQFWLSGRNVRGELRNIWVNRTSWANWHWWRERQRCRLTGVLGMKELLRRRFGTTWVPPAITVTAS